MSQQQSSRDIVFVAPAKVDQPKVGHCGLKIPLNMIDRCNRCSTPVQQAQSCSSKPPC